MLKGWITICMSSYHRKRIAHQYINYVLRLDGSDFVVEEMDEEHA